MTIEDSIASLLNNSTMKGLCKSIASISVVRPDKMPYVLYELVSKTSIKYLNCPPSEYTGIVRFHIIADTLSAVNNIADAIRDYLDGSDVSNNDWNVESIYLEDEEDIIQEVDEKQKPLYVKTIDFNFFAKR